MCFSQKQQKSLKQTWLVSDRDILLSNTIFQHFILLQYAILLLIVSCKNDCVLESVRPKTVELMLYLIVFKKKKKEKISLMEAGNVLFFSILFCPCDECKQCLLQTHLTIAVCV